jgi:hypothetical protein
MKRAAVILTVIGMLLVGVSMAQAADFTNGGFETGNLSGWTQGGGNWGGGSNPVVHVAYTGGALPTAPQYAGGTPNNAIMTSGFDPITGASMVYNGSYSVRVNDSNNNYSVSTLSQSVSNYAANNIYFEWNAILQGSHGLIDSDYFSLTLFDDTKNTSVLTRSYSSASAVGTFSLINGWYTSGWMVEQIDLTTAGAGGTSLVGDNFTLSLLASDCLNRRPCPCWGSGWLVCCVSGSSSRSKRTSFKRMIIQARACKDHIMLKKNGGEK